MKDDLPRLSGALRPRQGRIKCKTGTNASGLERMSGTWYGGYSWVILNILLYIFGVNCSGLPRTHCIYIPIYIYMYIGDAGDPSWIELHFLEYGKLYGQYLPTYLPRYAVSG